METNDALGVVDGIKPYKSIIVSITPRIITQQCGKCRLNKKMCKTRRRNKKTRRRC